jgi:hypothetical protein
VLNGLDPLDMMTEALLSRLMAKDKAVARLM